MRKLFILGVFASLALTSCENVTPDNSGAHRQAVSTAKAMDDADRETGMPRIANFSQRKLLKNAYEDMDQTTLTYVYTQSAMDGKFVCLGQGVGYGVSLGTQFTAPHVPEYHSGDAGGGNLLLDQADPNMLYMPTDGAATIVNLVNPVNGEAHTAVIEPNVVTLPFKLPASAVSVACPGDVDPTRVHDAKEISTVKQHS